MDRKWSEFDTFSRAFDGQESGPSVLTVSEYVHESTGALQGRDKRRHSKDVRMLLSVQAYYGVLSEMRCGGELSSTTRDDI
jgi:hypothetical protein